VQFSSPHSFVPNSDECAHALAVLPESSGIYALTAGDHPPHLSYSINLKRRLTRLLVPSYNAAPKYFSKYTEKLSSISYWPVASRLESALVLYAVTSHYYPGDYLRRLRLRMPWFLSLTTADAFPRLEVSNRLTRHPHTNSKLGPFQSRDLAQQYEEQLLSLHQLRRCTETLAPSPDHPGCIYGEMNQCLRPCQCVVSADEYASEAARVQEFLLTAGKSALNPLVAARERAAAELDFEQAAMLHKRIEKVQAAAASRDKVIAPVESFNGVALTKSTQADSVCLWPMLAGHWQAPVHLRVGAPQPDAKPLDALVKEALRCATGTADDSGNRQEHLAVWSRWYYSTWCDGQWFPFKTLEALNYRRMVREMGNLIKCG
jgi:excinuclease UvrABC nuclease subunit